MGTRICRYVKVALEANGELMAAVGGRAYHIIAPECGDVGYPYIVYASDGFDEEETKDGLYGDVVHVEIMVVARDGDTLEDVAHLVRMAMNNGPELWDTSDLPPFTVDEQTLRVGQEDWDMAHDCYFLTMNYTIEIGY